MNDEFLKPAEAAKRLGMPPSTLRVYSTKFGEMLSDAASNPPVSSDGRTGHRLYSDRDLVILAKAKEALARGLTYDQALAELRTVYAPAKVRARTAPSGNGGSPASLTAGHVEAMMAPLMAGIQNAQRAAEAWQRLAEERARENEELKERLRAVEMKIDRLEQRWQQLIGRIEEESVRQPGLLGRLLGR